MTGPAADDDPYGHFAPGPCSSRYDIAIGGASRVVPCGRPGPHDGEAPFGRHRTAGGHYAWTNATALGAAPDPRDPQHLAWCYSCERMHGPMEWGDGCTDDRDIARERVRHRLPWAPSFGFLTGRQCHARLTREQSGTFRRWGRCELARGHVSSDIPERVDHALEWGLIVLRWPAWATPEPYIEEGFGR